MLIYAVRECPRGHFAGVNRSQVYTVSKESNFRDGDNCHTGLTMHQFGSVQQNKALMSLVTPPLQNTVGLSWLQFSHANFSVIAISGRSEHLAGKQWQKYNKYESFGRAWVLFSYLTSIWWVE